MKRFVLTRYLLIVFLVVVTPIAVGIVSFEIGKRQNNTAAWSIPLIQKDNQSIDFPPLNMPVEYLDVKEVSFSPNGYDVIPDINSYHSYPTTNISIDPSMYSQISVELPPIKTDAEIHEKDPIIDFWGSYKDKSIKKYGDLARRFVGVAGDGTDIYKVVYADIDKDGKNETIVSICETGANVLAQWDVIIKGDKIIFSSNGGSFSTIIPAKNGNGFFLEWSEGKRYDGYTTTRFIYSSEKFIPVYEQTTEYIRVKSNQ